MYNHDRNINNQQRNGLTAMTLLYLTMLINFWIQQEPSILDDILFHSSSITSSSLSWWTAGYEWHSHRYTTIKSIFVSLFTHADWEHVASNMFLLWVVGKQLFVQQIQQQQQHCQDDNRIKRWTSWTSPIAFIWIYFGSQLMSVAGCRFISHWLDLEWRRRVERDRVNWTWQWVPTSVKDAFYTITNAEQAIELRAWQYTPMIGSSAAVFGVVGAHVYAALLSRDHPAQMDSKVQLMWLGKVGMELARTPFSLDAISSLNNEDNIDHASHLCGFIGGFVLAAVWDYFSRR